MDKRLRRLALSPLSSWLTGKRSHHEYCGDHQVNVTCRPRLCSQTQPGHSKVSFARRHSRRQAGASNLVLPSPRHRLAVLRRTQISIDQFDQFPCSPKHGRTQKSLDPTVREAFADVVLFFQVKCQREYSGRVMVWVDSQEQVATQATFAPVRRLTRSPIVTGGTLKRRPLRSHIIVGSRSWVNSIEVRAQKSQISSFSHQLTQLIESPTATELNRANFGCFAFTRWGRSHLRIIRKFSPHTSSLSGVTTIQVSRINWPEEQSRMVPTRVVMKIHHQRPAGSTRLRIP